MPQLQRDLMSIGLWQGAIIRLVEKEDLGSSEDLAFLFSSTAEASAAGVEAVWTLVRGRN